MKTNHYKQAVRDFNRMKEEDAKEFLSTHLIMQGFGNTKKSNDKYKTEFINKFIAYHKTKK